MQERSQGNYVAADKIKSISNLLEAVSSRIAHTHVAGSVAVGLSRIPKETRAAVAIIEVAVLYGKQCRVTPIKRVH